MSKRITDGSAEPAEPSQMPERGSGTRVRRIRASDECSRRTSIAANRRRSPQPPPSAPPLEREQPDDRCEAELLTYRCACGFSFDEADD